MANPFHFYTELHLIELTGIKAKNLVELLAGIKKVPSASIYHHTHRFLHQHHSFSPEPPNDFAFWITNILNQKGLGEELAVVNIIQYVNLEDLRNEFIRILEKSIKKMAEIIDCPEGSEFHFMLCKSFVLPTSHTANDLKEFNENLKKISIHSLYFHFFEARMRLKRDENDFSAWLKSLGYDELARALKRIDPYTITLEGLRQKIIRLVQRYG
jgi:Family of unknown function (DUF5752)